MGASATASESQPCSGKTGTLTAKATRKASEASQRAAEFGEMLCVAARAARVGRSKVPVLDVEPEDGDEQDGRGDEGVEEVFDGGAAAVFGAAEGGDEERHRDEGELPEAVVEEEVERDEDAEHRDLLEQEEDVEELLAASAMAFQETRTPSGREEAGEDDEPHGEAVDAEVVADGGGGDPGDVLLELEGAGAAA